MTKEIIYKWALCLNYNITSYNKEINISSGHYEFMSINYQTLFILRNM